MTNLDSGYPDAGDCHCLSLLALSCNTLLYLQIQLRLTFCNYPKPSARQGHSCTAGKDERASL